MRDNDDHNPSRPPMSPDTLPVDSDLIHNATASPKPVLSFQLLRGESLRIAATETRTDWLWKGYLAPGCMTMFTGQWKLGKTTLVALLLSRMATGGELVGQAVRQGRWGEAAECCRPRWTFCSRWIGTSVATTTIVAAGCVRPHVSAKRRAARSVNGPPKGAIIEPWAISRRTRSRRTGTCCESC